MLELKPDCFTTGMSVQGTSESSGAQDQGDPVLTAKQVSRKDCEAQTLARFPIPALETRAQQSLECVNEVG
jgi:hypothetical protein